MKIHCGTRAEFNKFFPAKIPRWFFRWSAEIGPAKQKSVFSLGNFCWADISRFEKPLSDGYSDVPIILILPLSVHLIWFQINNSVLRFSRILPIATRPRKFYVIWTKAAASAANYITWSTVWSSPMGHKERWCWNPRVGAIPRKVGNKCSSHSVQHAVIDGGPRGESGEVSVIEASEMQRGQLLVCVEKKKVGGIRYEARSLGRLAFWACETPRR